MWDLPGPGLEPVSPALAGGFLTTAPPGKSVILSFDGPTTRGKAIIVLRRGTLFHIVAWARIPWLLAGCVHLLFPTLRPQCLLSLFYRLPSSTHLRLAHTQHKEPRSTRYCLSIHSTAGTDIYLAPGTRISDRAVALRVDSLGGRGSGQKANCSAV